MLKLLCTDWAEYIFNILSLKIYEYEQEKTRKNKGQSRTALIQTGVKNEEKNRN